MFERGSGGIKDVPKKQAANSCSSPALNIAADVDEFPLGSARLAADIIPPIAELNCSERWETLNFAYTAAAANI